jgi:chromosomal replication initiation ATPase DnaA
MVGRMEILVVIGTVSEAFGVEPARLRVSRRHGNEARSAAIYLARQEIDTAVGAIRAYFSGVSAAAISKAVARVKTRRAEDRVWDLRLAELSEHPRTSGNCPKG